MTTVITVKYWIANNLKVAHALNQRNWEVQIWVFLLNSEPNSTTVRGMCGSRKMCKRHTSRYASKYCVTSASKPHCNSGSCPCNLKSTAMNCFIPIPELQYSMTDNTYDFLKKLKVTMQRKKWTLLLLYQKWNHWVHSLCVSRDFLSI